MNLDRIFDIAGMIVVLAIIFQVLASKNTATDVNALGKAFSDSIKAATGR